MKTAPLKSTDSALPRVSPAFLKFFAAYSRSYLCRQFHSVRILKGALPPTDRARPQVIYLNHAAWWDPLVCLLLARRFFADRTSFAPMESAMLASYGLFRRLGFFGIVPHSARGARTLLRTAHAILASPANALWLTPQGHFADVRQRPLQLESGLGMLATREPEATFVPLAIEYAFWTESRPEILVAFGEPISPRDWQMPADAWTRTFTELLEAAQDELAARSCRRDPKDWITLDRGKVGIGAIYDTWRRLRAKLRGEAFVAEHSTQSVQ